ncbi:hypothetical protein JRO89_XS15G0034700 [Xanthoceras sorbifolium]|uniref:Diacylglycerol O-acyltransferase n=1 Tax=Xanthoceras sorbifolium TaxID=99658 RepID=A0ABQ8H0Z5_9ROSI|nr:hypothetical protein JRO89_XS15G0034700 [Xanthoceras sorbifolium]
MVNGEASSTTDDDHQVEPLSPAARLFHAPRFNCHIIAIIGCKTSINPSVIKEGLKHSLINHPRFSSKLVFENKMRTKMKWTRITVNIEDHVIVPDLDPKMENPDQFVEDYISYMTTIPMDFSKPLWELHLLNVKTSDAEAIGVFRIHHSLGDGGSLISLLLACTRKTADPEALPTLPEHRRKDSGGSRGFWWLFLAIWTAIKLVWNTFMDLLVFVATLLFLKDTKNPLKGESAEHGPMRIVHRTVSLDDIKLVKTAMSMTVNDVVLGVTQAALSQYLNRSYSKVKQDHEQENQNSCSLPKSMRFSATVLVNLRPTTGIQALSIGDPKEPLTVLDDKLKVKQFEAREIHRPQPKSKSMGHDWGVRGGGLGIGPHKGIWKRLAGDKMKVETGNKFKEMYGKRNSVKLQSAYKQNEVEDDFGSPPPAGSVKLNTDDAMDVKEVMDIVNSGTIPSSDMGLVILEFHALLNKLRVLGCCFSPRSTNSVADGLSKYALVSKSVSFWIENCPPSDLANMMAKKSKVRWGNCIGYVLIPFIIALQNDPLDYVRRAKATIDRKKLSLEALCTYSIAKLVGGAIANRVLSKITMAFSNVVGPLEDISFYGHPLAFLAPTVYGHPQALTIHFQSYVNKMIVVIAVDSNVISDPRQLCEDIEESLRIIKDAAVEKTFMFKDVV